MIDWWFWSSASEIAKKSIASVLPETVLVIQPQESVVAKENPGGREMVDCGTEALIGQQPHRACGRGKTLSSIKAAAKARACRISLSSSSGYSLDIRA